MTTNRASSALSLSMSSLCLAAILFVAAPLANATPGGTSELCPDITRVAAVAKDKRDKWFIAAATGNLATLVAMITENSMECVDITDNPSPAGNGRTALMIAAAAGRTEAVQLLLLVSKADPALTKKRLRARSAGNDSLLVAATFSGELVLVNFVLKELACTGCQPPTPLSDREWTEAAQIAHSTRNYGLADCLESHRSPCEPGKGAPGVASGGLGPMSGAEIEAQVGTYAVHKTINESSKSRPWCFSGENWWCSVQASPNTPQLPDAFASPGAFSDEVLTAIRSATAPSLSYQSNSSPSPGSRSAKAQGQYRIQWFPDPEDRRHSLFAFGGINYAATATKVTANSRFGSIGYTRYFDFSQEYSANKIFALASVSAGRRDDSAKPDVGGKTFNSVDTAITNLNAAFWFPVRLPKNIFGDLTKEYGKTYGYAPLTFGLQKQKQSDGLNDSPINTVLYQYWRLDWIETIPWFPGASVNATRQWVNVESRSGRISNVGGKLWSLGLNQKLKDVPMTITYKISSGSDPLTTLPIDNKAVTLEFKYTPK